MTLAMKIKKHLKYHNTFIKMELLLIKNLSATEVKYILQTLQKINFILFFE